MVQAPMVRRYAVIAAPADSRDRDGRKLLGWG
jgi:hypothetical protein